MIQVKHIEKEFETYDNFVLKINEFIKNKEIINIQFLKTKELQIHCFITYKEN